MINTPESLRAARIKLDLHRIPFGRACGLTGSNQSVQVRVSQWETGGRAIPRHVALLTECFLQGARPSSWPSD